MNSTQTASHQDIDKVFLIRSKIGSYVTLDPESKMLLKEKYQKNPRPTRSELEEYSRSTKIPLDKVQNFFKYQRKIELRAGKLKSRFPKHHFTKHEQVILEEAFRENQKLDEKTKTYLGKKLRCNAIYIKRWFNYRNKKLDKIQKMKAKPPNNEKSELNIKILNEINNEVERLWFSEFRGIFFKPLNSYFKNARSIGRAPNYWNPAMFNPNQGISPPFFSFPNSYKI